MNTIEQTLLLDQNGKVINFWPIDSERVRLLKDCSILSLHGSREGIKRSPWKLLQYFAREYNWKGDVQWQFRSPYEIHHDVSRLSNGNTLLLEHRKVPNKGLKVNEMPRLLRADIVRIIDRAGKVQWSWETDKAFDHSYCGAYSCEVRDLERKNKKRTKRRVDWTHGNTVHILSQNKWSAKDRRFRAGNLMYHPRNFSTTYIIDRKSKKTVWQLPKVGEKNKDLMISGGHEPHIIAAGLPGEGNVLIFDNGDEATRAYSRVLEINPITFEIVWSYEDRERFFSRVAGSAQRLPNGNTLISEDVHGRIFEVTKDKEIVYEVKFFHRTGRAKKYALDHCGDSEQT